MTEAYCVKCKVKVQMKDPIESTTSRGTKIAKGTCEVCGTKKIGRASCRERV